LKRIDETFHLDNAFKRPSDIFKIFLFLLREDFTGMSRLGIGIVKALLY